MLVPRLVERRSPLIAPARTREAVIMSCSSLRRVFSSNSGWSGMVAFAHLIFAQGQPENHFFFFDLTRVNKAEAFVKLTRDVIFRLKADVKLIAIWPRLIFSNDLMHDCATIALA